MNTKATIDLIAKRELQNSVMLAYANGRPIQHAYLERDKEKWHDISSPNWCWHICDYRVKPEPQRITLYRCKSSGALLTYASIACSKSEISKYFDEVEFVEVVK